MLCDNLSIDELQSRLDGGGVIEFEKPAVVMLTGSKGRRDIVRAAGLPWLLLKSDFDEDAVKIDEGLVNTWQKAEEYCKDLARRKLAAVKNAFIKVAVICADTVVFNKRLLEKPRTEAEVYEMIRGLNGSKHQVITGVSVGKLGVKDSYITTFACVSEVLLSGVTEELIAEMIRRENPYACSGGYTIDGILSPYFKVLSGSRDNVIGLPLRETVEALGS